MEERLERLRGLHAKANDEVADAKAARKAISDAVEARGETDLTADETVSYRAKTAEIKELQERAASLADEIKELEEEIVRSGRNDDTAAKIAAGKGGAEVLSEPMTYERNSRHSYFHDLAMHTFGRADQRAQDRLSRHLTELDNHKEWRTKAMVGAEFRNLDRNDGTGGYAVPPLWLVNQFIELARPGRAYANLVPTEQLPSGTDSINVPKILTGTAAGIQTADNAAPGAANETDLTDGSVQANVKTIWGQQGLSMQLLEQSPVAFDQIVFRDLANAYAASLDVQVISGTGSNNQVTGVRNTSGILTVTATAGGSPTDLTNAMVAYKAIANAIAQVHTSRYMAPEVIVMHPRRWAAFLSVFGSDDRPLIAPNGNAFNQVGTLDAVASQRVVGGMQGLPVVTDPNLPINLGAGTNQDVIHVLRASDLVLYESSTRARALQETRANTLTVLLQLYGYLAFTAGRYPQSVVEIGGTALTTPAFA